MLTKQRPLKVFLCHAHSDKNTVRALYLRLTKDGVDAWLDKEKLLPGQDWELEIRKAVRESDVVVVCLSKQFNQAGFRQKEVRLALDTAMEQPDGEIFIIPPRLDNCDTLESLRKWHRVDLFEDDGYENLIRALRARADKIGATLDIKRDLLFKGMTSSKSGERASKEFAVSEESILRPPIEKQISVDVPTLTKNAAGMDNQGSVEDKPKRLDPTILAALIGAAVTIIVALIQFYANQSSPPPTSTLTAQVAFTSTVTNIPSLTDTITPEEPTFTPVPATDTPLPTFTGIPPVALGEDWTAGCISTLWKPYPADIPITEKGDGCWKEPVHVFYAENGDLDVLAEGRNEEPQIYGLFVPLPEKGTVTVIVRLNELTNVDVWLGIFAEQDVDSQGLLMTIPEGSAKQRVVVQKNPLNGVTITGTSLLEQGKGFSISFTFTANSARSTVNPSVFATDSVSIPSSQKWLFLGYKSLIGYYRIEGRFLEFELK